MRLPRWSIYLAALAIIALLALVRFGAVERMSLLFGGGSETTSSGLPTIGGPFTLTDQDGRAVKDTDFRGKLLLIYFGYTYCPDVCPTSLQNMTNALDALGPEAAQVQPLFITIDPERDTPAVLKAYIASFHPRLLGLTGTPQQIATVAKEYRAFFQRAGEGKDYLVDHSSIIYLMGRDGKFLAHFTHQTPVDQIVAGIRQHL